MDTTPQTLARPCSVIGSAKGGTPDLGYLHRDKEYVDYNSSVGFSLIARDSGCYTTQLSVFFCFKMKFTISRSKRFKKHLYPNWASH